MITSPWPIATSRTMSSSLKRAALNPRSGSEPPSRRLSAGRLDRRNLGLLLQCGGASQCCLRIPGWIEQRMGGQVLLGETNINFKSSHQAEAGVPARSKQLKKQANKHIEQASIHLVTRCIWSTWLLSCGAGGAAAVATIALLCRPQRTAC